MTESDKIMTNKELILAQLMRAMIKYDGGDAPRIQHFVKVHDFARMIAIAEGMNEEELFVLEAAAILHDVGIHVSQAKYGNCDGKHQEELGLSGNLVGISINLCKSIQKELFINNTP